MEQLKKPGRPRCEHVHQAILEATQTLLKTTPIREMTIEGIAKKASVGKPTIYRWWPCKCTLVMEAFAGTILSDITFPVEKNITAALQTHIRALIGILREQKGQTIADLIGEGQSRPDILALVREQFVTELQKDAGAAIERAKQNGELAKHFSTEILLDMIYGPIFYRLLIGHQPLDEAFSDSLVKTVEQLTAN